MVQIIQIDPAPFIISDPGSFFNRIVLSSSNWLGMNVVNFFAPEFAMNGTKTADKVVDDIIANPEKYEDVAYVIENVQSGELGKGIEEALLDRVINAKRIIFANFPMSVASVDTIAEVLDYNKQLVLG